MKTYECPKCGAAIKVNKNETIQKCEYCGIEFLIDEITPAKESATKTEVDIMSAYVKEEYKNLNTRELSNQNIKPFNYRPWIPALIVFSGLSILFIFLYSYIPKDSRAIIIYLFIIIWIVTVIVWFWFIFFLVKYLIKKYKK